jgi:hypothetical protein
MPLAKFKVTTPLSRAFTSSVDNGIFIEQIQNPQTGKKSNFRFHEKGIVWGILDKSQHNLP